MKPPKKSIYEYDGEIMLFGSCIGQMVLRTSAESKTKALSNITYNVKKKLGYNASAKVAINAEKLRKLEVAEI